MMMNMTWKIGVNSQARRLMGSAPGCAGSRGGCGVGEACGCGRHAGRAGSARGRARDHDQDDEQEEGDRSRSGASGAADCHEVRASLANRVIAAPAPGMTAGDPPGAHPAPLEESVLLDGLLGVAGTGRFVAAARRHPREDDPVELDRTRSRCASTRGTSECAALDEGSAQSPDQRVLIGIDDRRLGDDEDVPAGLE